MVWSTKPDLQSESSTHSPYFSSYFFSCVCFLSVFKFLIFPFNVCSKNAPIQAQLYIYSAILKVLNRPNSLNSTYQMICHLEWGFSPSANDCQTWAENASLFVKKQQHQNNKMGERRSDLRGNPQCKPFFLSS